MHSPCQHAKRSAHWQSGLRHGVNWLYFQQVTKIFGMDDQAAPARKPRQNSANGTRLPKIQWKSISIGWWHSSAGDRGIGSLEKRRLAGASMCSPPASRLQRAAIVVALERCLCVRACRGMKLGNLAVNY